jgi:type IV secretion system protein VirB3
MALRRLPFHRVLHRPQLLWGGERELVLMLAVICVGLAVNGLNPLAFAVAGGLWALGLPALRWMAKKDPQLSKVYLAQRHFRGYYPWRSTPYRVPPRGPSVRGLDPRGPRKNPVVH